MGKVEFVEAIWLTTGGDLCQMMPGVKYLEGSLVEEKYYWCVCLQRKGLGLVGNSLERNIFGLEYEGFSKNQK